MCWLVLKVDSVDVTAGILWEIVVSQRSGFFSLNLLHLDQLTEVALADNLIYRDVKKSAYSSWCGSHSDLFLVTGSKIC
jgi:hypothetical protein